MTKAQDWQDTLDDLDRRRDALPRDGRRRSGWPSTTARASSTPGRASTHLLDPGSFRELGTLVGGDIAGRRHRHRLGLIDGSPVMVGAEDFTTLAGTIGPGGNSKRYRIAELALRDKIPLVMMLEGAGFRPTGSTTAAPRPT